MKKLLFLIAFFLPICIFAQGLINDFEWLEPNNDLELLIGESYQLKYSCSNNSLPFTSDYADSWVHYDFAGGQHIVSEPTGYSIDNKGVITGLVAGSYAIKFTGLIQPKNGTNKWLYITVVSERWEKESNNTFDTANDITNKIRFGLYNISDIDYFRFTNNNLKLGDNVTFKIHYYGSRENPFGYKWATFCGGEMVGGGSLTSQDQECNALVTSANSVYLEVYYDQSRSQYFNYGEEFVAEVFINGIPASEYGNDKPDEQQNMINGHEFVDLGLPSGNLWAKTNYGASSEGDYGIYIDWPVRNIIHTGWGNEWSTPSQSDFLELYNNCRFSWEYNSNSVFGCRVTGPNGNSIFLPAAGFKIYGTPQMVGSDIYYWSDNENGSGFAYALQGSAGNGISVYQSWNIELVTFPIRPVVSIKSPQPYAALSDNDTVLTFYYDKKKIVRKGMDVGPITYDKINYKPLSEWNDYSSSIKKVVFDDSFADCHDITSTAYWFESFRNLEEIKGLNNLNTENVTDMKRMFIWCSNLKNIDMSNFNTENVTDMSQMFQQCSSLQELNFETFNTKNVVNMHQMFHGCSSVTTLDLSNFETGNVTDMGLMFYQCDNLETLDLSNFNTENVTDMSVFHDCNKLKTIYVNHDWNTEKVSENTFVFYHCYSLEGGQGTKWKDGEIWPIYARIDRGPSAPGYFTEKTSQLINGHEYVDLGLPSGNLWAKTNYGASSEGAYGVYMGWRERNKIQSDWGKEWSTPSQMDYLELFNQCTFTWEYNAKSVYGCKLTGTNGNSIFLPAAGAYSMGEPYGVGSSIVYWSDNEYDSEFAYSLYGSAEKGIKFDDLCFIEVFWIPIRPVAKNNSSSGGEGEENDYVDLALPSGLLWAKKNVGANSPEECGSYFAWGETSPKSEYSWSTYKYANGSETTLTKYCNDSSYGIVDYKDVLEEQDDAATVNWGQPWRTPTLSETQELITYCSWTLTSQKGVSGYKVTGANGNSIFLPAGGVMQFNWSYFTERSVVMSATIFNYCTSASVLNCQDGAPHYWYGWSRCWGYPVRPVYDKNIVDDIPMKKESVSSESIFEINGIKKENLTKGLNIVRMKDGRTKKILVK